MFIFVLVLLAGLIGLVWLIVASQGAHTEANKKWVASIRLGHALPIIVYNGTTALGVNSDNRKIGVFRRDGDGYVLTGDHVRSVELTPIYQTVTDSTGETRTNRGSQLLSAGIGSAIAGPVGLLAGGLSGSTRNVSQSVSQQNLVSMEINVRFLSDEVPLVVIATGMVDDAREIAARLANMIDMRPAALDALPPVQSVQTVPLTDEEFASLPLAPVQRGWWSRTFGS